MGRDLRLNPRRKGKPLNYFVYPYVEVDGQEFANVITWLFRSPTRGQPSPFDSGQPFLSLGMNRGGWFLCKLRLWRGPTSHAAIERAEISPGPSGVGTFEGAGSSGPRGGAGGAVLPLPPDPARLVNLPRDAAGSGLSPDDPPGSFFASLSLSLSGCGYHTTSLSVPQSSRRRSSLSPRAPLPRPRCAQNQHPAGGSP